MCLIGIFDKIWATKTPATHAQAVIAFSLVGEPGEQISLKLQIIRPTGAVLNTFENKIVLPDTGSIRSSFEIRNMILPDFGPYAIQVDLGEGPPKAVSLIVQPPPQKPRTG